MDSNENGKTFDGDAELRAFMDALEHPHEQPQQAQPKTEADMLVSASRALLEVVELTRTTQELVKLAAGNSRLSPRLDWCPPAFARILIDSGVKCDESRREAVRKHVELLGDLQRHEAIRASSQGDQQRLWADSVTRWRRQMSYNQDTLRNLGVTIRDQLVGERFDPLLHEPVDTAPTQNPDEVDTIAVVQQPLFSWKDENGTPQCVPALVVLFALENA